MFKIEDEIHSELQKVEFETFIQALDDLITRANIPWDKDPNRCPCEDWKTCGRQYQIVEYDNTDLPWREIDRQDILTISAHEIKWNEEIKTRYNIL